MKYTLVFLEVFAQEGGIQSYVKDILTAFLQIADSEHCQIDVFLLRDKLDCENPLDTGLIKFHYLFSKDILQSRYNLVINLFAHLLTQKTDYLFCGHINLAPLINLYSKLFHIPYTVLTYGKEVWETLPNSKIKALQEADQVWTISRYSGDRLCASNQVSPEKVKILPCVVEGTIFTPGEKPPELLEKYGLSDAKVLMTVARLWSGDIYKGVDVTIRALPQILAVFPQVKYLVIGRGDDQPRLAQLAKELGVENQVIFAGFVPTEELVNHYRVADAYIMPSQEGFGIVYLEALSCGIPVLAGNSDGSADPLQDGRLGWQIPHRDVHQVALACINILEGRDPRCNGQWLRQETLAKFGRENLINHLKILLENLN